MVRGFDRPSAARFAFLMSAPILLAAGAYESLKVIDMTGTTPYISLAQSEMRMSLPDHGTVVTTTELKV